MCNMIDNYRPKSQASNRQFPSSESEPISVFGKIIPLRLARWKTAHVVGYLTIKHRVTHVFTFGSSCFLVSLLARNNREALEAAGEMLAVGFLAELGPICHSGQWPFLPFSLSVASVLIAGASLVDATNETPLYQVGARSLKYQQCDRSPGVARPLGQRPNSGSDALRPAAV